MSSIFINNKYKKIYINLIEKAKLKEKSEYSEIHHIIPSSIGGTDDIENLISLSLREHYIVHLLLVKMLKSTKHKMKMVYALGMLSNRCTHFNSRLYEQLKIKHIQRGITKTYYNKVTDKIIMIYDDDYIPDGFIRGTRPFSEEHKNKMMKPKTKEHAENIGKSSKGKHHFLNKETGEARFLYEKPNTGKWIRECVNKGKKKIPTIFYHNPDKTEHKRFKITDIIPKGWIKGRITSPKQLAAAHKNLLLSIEASSIKNKNTIHCYDPITLKERKLKCIDDIPKGWVKGRSPKNIRTGWSQTENQKQKAREIGLNNKGKAPGNKGKKMIIDENGKRRYVANIA